MRVEGEPAAARSATGGAAHAECIGIAGRRGRRGILAGEAGCLRAAGAAAQVRRALHSALAAGPHDGSALSMQFQRASLPARHVAPYMGCAGKSRRRL